MSRPQLVSLSSLVEDALRFADHYGPALRFAALSATFYVVWFFVFGAWVEPVLRRCAGIVVRARVVWVPAAGSFRIWGLGQSGSLRQERMTGLLCGISVLAASLVPAIALCSLAVALRADAALAASAYLMSVPMIGLFVLRTSFRAEPFRQVSRSPRS